MKLQNLQQNNSETGTNEHHKEILYIYIYIYLQKKGRKTENWWSKVEINYK